MYLVFQLKCKIPVSIIILTDYLPITGGQHQEVTESHTVPDGQTLLSA